MFGHPLWEHLNVATFFVINVNVFRWVAQLMVPKFMLEMLPSKGFLKGGLR